MWLVAAGSLSLFSFRLASAAAVGRCVLPTLNVDVQGLHVVLADIFISQLRPFGRGKFAWRMSLESRPSPIRQFAQPKQRLRGGEASALLDFGIPADAKYARKLRKVRSLFLLDVDCLCLTPIQ